MRAIRRGFVSPMRSGRALHDVSMTYAASCGEPEKICDGCVPDDPFFNEDPWTRRCHRAAYRPSVDENTVLRQPGDCASECDPWAKFNASRGVPARNSVLLRATAGDFVPTVGDTTFAGQGNGMNMMSCLESLVYVQNSTIAVLAQRLESAQLPSSVPSASMYGAFAATSRASGVGGEALAVLEGQVAAISAEFSRLTQDMTS
jgi:hypothetical protein